MSLTIKRQADLIEHAQIRRAQCDVALAHLKNIEITSQDPLLLIEEPEDLFYMDATARALEQNPSSDKDRKFKISIEIQKSKFAKLSPVKLCPNVKKWAAENRVRVESQELWHKDGARPKWLRINSNDLYDWRIIEISMPVISADGNSAYLNESQVSGPLAGGESALEYTLPQNGIWRLTKRITLSVS